MGGGDPFRALWGALLTGRDSRAASLAGWTLESEALARGMGTWLLVCSWVGLGVLVPGEGGGEGTSEVWGEAAGQAACPTPRGGCGRTVLGPALQGPAWTPVLPTCRGPEHGHPDLPALP